MNELHPLRALKLMNVLAIFMATLLITVISGCGGGGSGATPPPTEQQTSAPAAPASVKAVYADNQISIEWSPSGAAEYRIEREINGTGNWFTVATALSGAAVVDTNLFPSATYQYRVIAIASAVESAATFSEEVKVPAVGGNSSSQLSTNSSAVNSSRAAGSSQGSLLGQSGSSSSNAGTVKSPASPSNFKTSFTNSVITLSWSAVAGATHYRVERRTGAEGDWTLLEGASKNVQFVDTSVQAAQTYQYRVFAFKDLLKSVSAIGVLVTVPSDIQSRPDLAAGASQFASQCSSCHGVAGTGRISLMNCKSCNSLSSLTKVITETMPQGNPANCSGSCALDTAGFILSLQKKPQAVVVEFDKVQQLDWLSTYRKVSNNLAGRLPTNAEITALTSGGEQAFDNLMTGLLDEPVFYERLREIFNDRWLVRKFQNGAYTATAEIDVVDFPNRDWFDKAGYNEQQRRDARIKTNQGFVEESLALVEYLARNNRPFTEIVTAKYTMVTPFTAKSYGVESSVSFSDPTDADEWRPVAIPGVAHAGVLSQPIFLSRHPTTETNRGRHRAYITYLDFLDTDILATSKQPLTTSSEGSENPTLNDANCTMCHNAIDPVAQLFSNYQTGNRFTPVMPQFADMLDAGISNKIMPASYDKKRLQWLGLQIAQDNRFARAMLRTLYKGMTGHDTLSSPEDGNPSAVAAYAAQRGIFAPVEKAFIDSNYNLKTLIKALVKTPYIRINGLNNSIADYALYETSSTAQLLTPEMLDRKISAVLGQPWKYVSVAGESAASGTRHLLRNPAYLRDIYGGINSSDVTERIRDANGLIVAVQARMANQMSCISVANDFYLPKSKRKLFPNIEISTVPFDVNGLALTANQAAITHNIIYLQQRLLGKVDADLTAELNDLFNDVRTIGLKRITADGKAKVLMAECQVREDPQTGSTLAANKQIINDDQYTVRSWMAVVRFLLNDYAFLYE